MSSPAARDPRRDPKPGDVLRVGPKITVVSVPLLVGRMSWRSSDCPGVRRSTRTDWREWAKNAEVIHAAD